MQLPVEIVRVRAHGDREAPYWLAWSDDGQHVGADPGESVLVRGQADVTMLGPERVHLGVMDIAFTERRMTLRADHIGPEPGGYWAFTGAALVLATTANAVSKHRARKAREGTVAVGHVRYEWIGIVEHRTDDHRHGLIVYYPTAGGPGALLLHGAGWPDAELARWLVRAAAHDRLQLDPGVLGAQDRAELERLRATADQTPTLSPGERRLSWTLPGEPDRLVEAAYSSRFVSPQR